MGCCSLYLVIIFLWLPFIHLSGDIKKGSPQVQQKCPGHCSNPDLFTRIRARYLLDYVNPDLHRVIYTSIAREVPLIIDFVSYAEPHDKCFPNQNLFISVFFSPMSCFSLAFQGKVYRVNFFKLFVSFFPVILLQKSSLASLIVNTIFSANLTFRRDAAVRLSGRITFVAYQTIFLHQLQYIGEKHIHIYFKQLICNCVDIHHKRRRS